MNGRKGIFMMYSVIAAAVLFFGGDQVSAQSAAAGTDTAVANLAPVPNGAPKMKRMTNAERWKAAIRSSDRRADHKRHQKMGGK